MRFLGRLKRPRGGLVVLVNAIAPLSFPPAGRRLPASMRATIQADAVRVNTQRAARAQRKVDAAASLLKGAGWPTLAEVRFGAPLEALLDAATQRKCDALVVGARETRGLRRALPGSVAAGALNYSRVPVLIVP